MGPPVANIDIPSVLTNQDEEQKTPAASQSVSTPPTRLPDATPRTSHWSMMIPRVMHKTAKDTGKTCRSLPTGTPLRTAHDPAFRERRCVCNRTSKEDPLELTLKNVPKLMTHTPPTSTQNIKWDDKIASIPEFVQHCNGWFPSVGCQAIIVCKNLECCAKHGVKGFVEACGGPLGDPHCNRCQINCTVNFLCSVWATAFSGTAAFRSTH